MSRGKHSALAALLRPSVPALGVVAGALLATAVTSCGNELAPGAVARVGDQVIERAEFDHWLQAAARGQQAASSPGSTEEVAVPMPPDFEQCIASKEEQARTAIERAEQGSVFGDDAPAPELPSADELEQQCGEEYELLKEQVMQFLIQAEAIEQEAAERDIDVDDAQVETRLDDLRRQSFPNDRAFEQFLEQSGMTEDDLEFRVRLDLLINEIRENVIDEQGEITEEDIEAYYDEHRTDPPIGRPEQRDVRLVRAETEEEAAQAREQLESGASFRDVADEHSIDPESREQGGRLTIGEGEMEDPLDEEVFGTGLNTLVGPVETELGWYVFEVEDIQEARTQSLDEASEPIREIIATQQETEALADFQQQFSEEVRDETICAEQFTIVGCSNGPDPEESSDPGVPTQPPPPAPGAPSPGAPGAAPGEPLGPPPEDEAPEDTVVEGEQQPGLESDAPEQGSGVEPGAEQGTESDEGSPAPDADAAGGSEE